MIAVESRFSTNRNLKSPSQPGFEPMLEAAMEKCGEFEETAAAWIQRHPAIGVGMAIAVGVTLGWISKRR